ncbi:MAG: hypothetical protein COV47_01460 [Candidatus Diapherotrites archaeon CG11_big_fil_rev_8_21_14_0_20_37_9]|nr:MAG: hypothetical protein COV47_01460 [Candidatus Diapherotrites archaeon CG11_big_fil_rev_8_21_14_0_20_37_9]
MERKIQISNIPKTHHVDKDAITQKAIKTYDKINTRIPGELTLDIHFKEAKIQGNREQIEAKVKAVVASTVLNATFIEWNAEKALTLCLAAIEKEAAKKTESKKI